MEINKNNVEVLYQYMIEDIDTLEGVQWERLATSDYSTPASIIDDFINIFLDTEFVEWIDYNHTEKLIANRQERKLALIKYFKAIIQSLEEGDYDE